MKKIILFILIILNTGLILKCEDNDYPKYYKKRRWCKKTKEFSYRMPIEETKAKKNFNKLFKKGNYIVHGQFKDPEYPIGNWFYYDSKNRVAKEEAYKNAYIADEFVYEYDSNSNKLSETHYVYSDKSEKRLRIKSEYSYDYKIKKKGLLIEARHYNAARLDEVIRYEYLNNGLLRKKSLYLYDNRLKSYNLYSYNPSGLLKQEKIYTTKGLEKNAVYKLNLVITYSYNNKNSLVKREKYKPNKGDYNKLVDISEYTYNKKDNLIKKVDLNSKKEKLSEIRLYYDKYNCKSKEEYYNGKGELEDIKNF